MEFLNSLDSLDSVTVSYLSRHFCQEFSCHYPGFLFSEHHRCQTRKLIIYEICKENNIINILEFAMEKQKFYKNVHKIYTQFFEIVRRQKTLDIQLKDCLLNIPVFSHTFPEEYYLPFIDIRLSVERPCFHDQYFRKMELHKNGIQMVVIDHQRVRILVEISLDDVIKYVNIYQDHYKFNRIQKDLVRIIGRDLTWTLSLYFQKMPLQVTHQELYNPLRY